MGAASRSIETCERMATRTARLRPSATSFSGLSEESSCQPATLRYVCIHVKNVAPQVIEQRKIFPRRWTCNDSWITAAMLDTMCLASKSVAVVIALFAQKEMLD